MEGGRNWPKTLLAKASFKGIPFEVEREGIEDAGRLVALHPFVKAEKHATEDMGRKARRFAITAYIANNNADKDAYRLVETCSSPGPGRLELPMTYPVSARCISCPTDNAKKKQGFVAFALLFVESGLETGGFPPLRLNDRIIKNLLDGLGGKIRDIIKNLPPPQR